MRDIRADTWLALCVLAFSLFTLFIWIPADVDTGIIEKVRRRTEIGDAFAPTIAASLLLLGSILLFIEKSGGSNTTLTISSLRYTLILLLAFALALFLMRWTGPLLVSLFGDTDTEYRLLRDTVPWKYAGFVAGGVMLIVALIALVERRLHWRAFLIAIGACLAMIVLYDLPFDDLLLPPNGDV